MLNDKQKNVVKNSWELIKHYDRQATRWCNHLGLYSEIYRSPDKLTHLHNHPGMKFMDRGWNIVGLIIAFLVFVGAVFGKR